MTPVLAIAHFDHAAHRIVLDLIGRQSERPPSTLAVRSPNLPASSNTMGYTVFTATIDTSPHGTTVTIYLP